MFSLSVATSQAFARSQDISWFGAYLLPCVVSRRAARLGQTSKEYCRIRPRQRVHVCWQQEEASYRKHRHEEQSLTGDQRRLCWLRGIRKCSTSDPHLLLRSSWAFQRTETRRKLSESNIYLISYYSLVVLRSVLTTSWTPSRIRRSNSSK